MSRKRYQRVRVLDYDDDYEDEDYGFDDEDDDDLDYGYDDDDDLEEEDIDFDDDEDDDYYDDDEDYEEDDEEDAPRPRRKRKRSSSRSRSRSRSSRSRSSKSRSRGKSSRPSKTVKPKRETRPAQPKKVAPAAPKKKTEGKPKKKASRVPVVILTLLLLGVIGYSAVVVLKNNELQSQGEVIQAENNLMAEKLESAGLSPEVLPYQDGSNEEVTPKPYVLTIWNVEPVITVTGTTMDVSVKASVMNDSSRVLDDENVPQLISGGQKFAGNIEGGGTIPAFHGEGVVVWRATGLPIETMDFLLEVDDQHLVYYLERISDSVAAKKQEMFGV